MLDDLRSFVLITEHGTFTEAARHAHLSQPALTAAIRRLEERVGAQLLARGRHGASLTAAGSAFLPKARAALTAVEDGIRAARQIEGLDAGEVRVGAGATVCTYLLPPVIAEFRRAHPAIKFVLRESTTDLALDELAKGELDLAIVTTKAGERWIKDELVLIASPHLDEPSRAPFVTFRRGATTRDLLERHFPSAHVVMELGSIAAVKANVRAGIGIALVSLHAIVDDLAASRLVIVPDSRTPIARPLRIVHRGLDRLSPAAAALRKMLLAHAQNNAKKSQRSKR
jgi:DNA-binding transcriptional LysR family regulator